MLSSIEIRCYINCVIRDSEHIPLPIKLLNVKTNVHMDSNKNDSKRCFKFFF